MVCHKRYFYRKTLHQQQHMVHQQHMVNQLHMVHQQHMVQWLLLWTLAPLIWEEPFSVSLSLFYVSKKIKINSSCCNTNITDNNYGTYFWGFVNLSGTSFFLSLFFSPFSFSSSSF